MFSVRWTRVLLGGLVAGVVINACEYLLNGVLLAERWADAMRALNHAASFNNTEIAAFNIWGFLMGIGAVWLYASIRDHYGPGLRTAIYAGLAVWLIGCALGAIPAAAMNVFPRSLFMYGILMGLFEILAGTLAGAWLYRPAEMTIPAHA